MQNMTYDYAIVGAGFYGAVFARVMADHDRRCLVVERRPHIGGNCYTEDNNRIPVHKYGAHIFHTNDCRIWAFVNRFSCFNSYVHTVKVNVGNVLYSFPINLFTMKQIWGIETAEEAAAKLGKARVINGDMSSLEGWARAQVGDELYSLLIRGYTAKQWGRHPRELPASIIKRIPVRLEYDERYFTDQFQGIPNDGYTPLFVRLLDSKNISLRLGVDYLEDKRVFSRIARRIVYTGAIDELFKYRFGALEYRSLRFEEECLDGAYQEVAVVNHGDESIPYTRIIEHKHFYPDKRYRTTVITREYPEPWSVGKERYYPVRDAKNIALYDRYAHCARRYGIIAGGRLGTYQYYDMHQVVGSALVAAKRELLG